MPLRGTVIDNDDPMQRGRCRVRVWGVHKEEDSQLPWAEVLGSTAFGLHKGVGVSSVLQVGTTVWVDWEQSDLQCPIIIGVFVGHDATDMAQISSDNSDFNPDAKGENYKLVQLITTPGGNRFELNDKDGKVSQSNKCGMEVTMDCSSGALKITNGQAVMTFQGDTINIEGQVHSTGPIQSDAAVYAPNLCYCGSPGSYSPPKSDSQKKDENTKECNPGTSNGQNTCDSELPANTDLETLTPNMKKLVEMAMQIYKKNTGGDMVICETKMTPSRYVCLKNASRTPLEKAQLYGSAVDANPTGTECAAGANREDVEGCYHDDSDTYHYSYADGTKACYALDDKGFRSLVRAMAFEVGSVGSATQRAHIAGVIFNRIRVGSRSGDSSWGTDGLGTAGLTKIIETGNQFSYHQTHNVGGNNLKPGHVSKELWEKINQEALGLFNSWRDGKWQDNIGEAVFYKATKNTNMPSNMARQDVRNAAQVAEYDGLHTFWFIGLNTLLPSKSPVPYGPR